MAKVNKKKQENSFQTSNSSMGGQFALTKKWYFPYVLLVALFYIISAAYFSAAFQGMEFNSHDSSQWTAMSKESMDYFKEHKEYAQWSGRMFSGMPGVMLWGMKHPDIVDYTGLPALNGVHLFPDLFMYEFFMLGFLAALSLFLYYRRLIPAIIGGLAVQLSTVTIVSLAAGHVNKIGTLAFFVPILFSTLLILRKEYIKGMLLFILCLHSMLLENHTQIVYYIMLYVVPFVVVKAIKDFLQDKNIKHLLTSGLIMLVSCVVAAMMHSTIFLQNDFLKETTRGQQILNFDNNQSATEPKAGEDGVGVDYATQWSYSVKEIGSWLIPNFVGGASGGAVDEGSNTFATLTGNGVGSDQALGFCERLPLYWGDQPFVAGPYYLGAIVIFLFFFGMLLYRGAMKWYLLALIVFSTLMALGKNFLSFYDLLYSYFPLFNKFRTPTMIIAVIQICMVLIGVLGIMELVSTKVSEEDKKKALKYSGGIVAGLCLFFLLMGGSLLKFQSYHKETAEALTADESFKQQLTGMVGSEQFATDIVNAVKKDRAVLFRKDATRSTVFVLLAIGLLYLLLYRNIKATYILSGLAFLIVMDLWQIDRRYLSDKNFVPEGTVEEETYPLTAANQRILEDKGYYRMIDFTVSPFNDAGPCLYHHTVGGYNPNKLRRYQDIVENGFQKDFAKLNQGRLQDMHYLNMLNCKYIKTGAEADKVITNPYANGPAWFVNRLKIVSTPEEEISLVDSLNPLETAIIHKEFEKEISDMMLGLDTSSSQNRFIRFVSYDPKYMVYESNSDKDEFAVFSEVIYRPNTEWKAFIDGKEVKHIRVNYILRGMRVPSGKHKIEFKYDNPLFHKTYNMAYIGSIIFILIFAGGVFLYIKDRKNRKAADNTNMV
jgi:hypothetical protein